MEPNRHQRVKGFVWFARFKGVTRLKPKYPSKHSVRVALSQPSVYTWCQVADQISSIVKEWCNGINREEGFEDQVRKIVQASALKILR
jgi:hypothetical protein